MPTKLERIRQKLDHLRTADLKYKCFGAYRHQYRLGQKLAESRLVKIEAFYEIKLPSDYADFLTQIGNGGAGPSYGPQRFGTIRMLPRSFSEPGPGELKSKTYRFLDWYEHWLDHATDEDS